MGDNLFADIPSQLPNELIEVLVENPALRIERIVSDGHRSEDDFWYDQEEHEWVQLIQGQASIEFDNGDIRNMIAGDYLLITAHTKHRVKSTSEYEQTIWLVIFYT